MVQRTTLAHTSHSAQTTMSRATVREVADNHLMQEVKKADVYHSETPSDFERWQMVGLTAVPFKQQEDQKKKKQQPQQTGSSGKKEPDFNHDQPTGPAAEAVMLYLNGQRSHPVAVIDDRRVRPYGMKEGEAAFYDPTGSEQMVFYNKNGAYLVSLDGKTVKDPKAKDERMASLRHVKKDMQSHDGEKVEKEKDYKHEGKEVNTEVRVTAKRIEFYNGDKLVGFYDKGANKWELFEVGGNLKLIIDGSKICGQYGDTNKSFLVDNKHTHIKFGGNAIWVNDAGCWSTTEINQAPDPSP